MRYLSFCASNRLQFVSTARSLATPFFPTRADNLKTKQPLITNPPALSPQPWTTKKLTSWPLHASSSSSSMPQPSPDENTPNEGTTNFLLRFAKTFTILFPLWVLVAAISGFYQPSLYTWFDSQWTQAGLMVIMGGMGLTLTLDDITQVFSKQPQLLLLGMVLQYSVLPAIGYVISRSWGLTEGLAVGIALVSCMPGGTASNIMAFLAKGEMGLSLMMTTASTLMAIVMTPLLTLQLVGTLVPVDAKAMFLSVLQLVLAPVLVGALLNTYVPDLVTRAKAYMPFLATFMCCMIIGSMVGTNAALVAKAGLPILTAVTALHSSGFFLGYAVSKGLGLSNKIARTNSIEVGMQSSALAGVLAKLHFTDPAVVVPCVCSAVVMCLLGSMLSGIWALTVKDGE